MLQSLHWRIAVAMCEITENSVVPVCVLFLFFLLWFCHCPYGLYVNNVPMPYEPWLMPLCVGGEEEEGSNHSRCVVIWLGNKCCYLICLLKLRQAGGQTGENLLHFFEQYILHFLKNTVKFKVWHALNHGAFVEEIMWV